MQVVAVFLLSWHGVDLALRQVGNAAAPAVITTEIGLTLEFRTSGPVAQATRLRGEPKRTLGPADGVPVGAI